MSLISSGVSIKIISNRNTIGYGFDKINSAAALRIAIEEFIKSDKFKEFTESSCYNNIDLKLEFLLHTVMPN